MAKDQVDDSMPLEEREATEMQPVMMEEETASVVDTEPHPDSMVSDLEKELEQATGKSQEGGDGFGESMRLVKLSTTEVNVLRQSFDMLLQALGSPEEAKQVMLYFICFPYGYIMLYKSPNLGNMVSFFQVPRTPPAPRK